MRFLKIGRQGNLSITQDLNKPPGPYAILSHRWCSDNDEVTFDNWKKLSSKSKPGYAKLAFCADQARRDGLEYIWVDTCCINRNNLVELDEAIRSMFRWYKNAEKCYVHLADVVLGQAPDNSKSPSDWKTAFRESTWFRRGWTLQELLAPQVVEFFSKDRQFLGTKATLEDEISTITNIPVNALRGEDLSKFSIEARFSWAEKRETTKKEDRAYCLFGIFNVFLPLMYGEEEAAFARLQQEIGITVSQIDATIQAAYQSRHIAIERLSGKSLPLEDCFVNLCVVDYKRNTDTRLGVSTSNTGTEDKDLMSKFSLAARLKVENLPKSKQVSLPTMFDPRTRRDGSKFRPNRILIWGGAGTGKTTLCKKMVHDFYHNGLWNALYDRVIWLPLRKLKLMETEISDAAGLVQREFYSTRTEKNIKEVLQKSVLQDPRTLFILDGLDEVSYAFDFDSPAGHLLDSLITSPNTIITSRPHSTSVLDHMPPDLELETIGFSQQQVAEYIEVMARQSNMPEETTSAIQLFVKNNALVASLARIPVQLDAICFVWNSRYFPKDTVTMTTLYSAISWRLWASDIVRLGKLSKLSRRPITKQQIEQTSNIEVLVEDENQFLQELAFQGLCNEIIEFDSADIARLSTGQTMLGDVPVHMSFLRSSDNSLEASNRTLHFIHLTFQEYFAARYFIRHWTSRAKLLLWKGSQHERSASQKSCISPEEFLRTEKYVDRYNIFWRFVTGLLYAEADHSHLRRFLRVLEDEPFDLFGLAHHRLVIHCLSEMIRDDIDFKLEIKQREQSCIDWILRHSRLERFGYMNTPVREAECSDHMIVSLLDTYEMRHKVLEVLYHRPYVTPAVLKMVLQILQRDSILDRDLRKTAIEVLARHCNENHEETCRAFWRDLPASSTTKQLEVVGALRNERDLQSSALDALVSLLQDTEDSVRSKAAYILQDQSDLPSSAIEALIILLHDSQESVWCQAADILSHQSDLPSLVIEKLTTDLRDPQESAQSAAAKALSNQSSLPDSAIEALVTRLHNSEESVWSVAAEALGNQSSLPKFALEALVTLLHDSEESVRSAAAEALGNQSGLPDSAIEALITLLHDSEESVRSAAAEALGNQSGLPDSAIEALVTRLYDTEQLVRSVATEALGNQSSLPDSAIEALVTRLYDTEELIRSQAALAIGSQSSLPKSTIDAFVTLLCDSERSARSGAAFTLDRQPSLPGSTIEALVNLLHNPLARFEAGSVLCKQHSLPSSVIDALISLLHNPESSVHSIAARVLIHYDSFYTHIPYLPLRDLQGVIQAWLETNIVSCSMQNCSFRINVDGRQRVVALEEEEQVQLMAMWGEAQLALGLPVQTGLGRKSNKESDIDKHFATVSTPRKRKSGRSDTATTKKRKIPS